MKYDNVNNPKHYALANKTLNVQSFDICQYYYFAQGNAIKYAIRYKNKNGKEDLKKCLWYLDHIKSKSIHTPSDLLLSLINLYKDNYPIAYTIMIGNIYAAKNLVTAELANYEEDLDKAVQKELFKKESAKKEPKKKLPDAWFSFLEMLDSISKLLNRGNTQIKFNSYLKTLHAYGGSLPDDKFLEYVTYLITTANDLILDNISDFLDSIEGLKVVTFFKTLTAEGILQVIKEYNED